MLAPFRYSMLALLGASALAVSAAAQAPDLRAGPSVAEATRTATPAPAPPLAVVQTAPRQASCMADWSEAGPIVRREGLATIERVGRLARDKASVEIVTSALCKAEDRYVYRLTVRSSLGTLRTMIVDARQPFGP